MNLRIEAGGGGGGSAITGIAYNASTRRIVITDGNGESVQSPVLPDWATTAEVTNAINAAIDAHPDVAGIALLKQRVDDLTRELTSNYHQFEPNIVATQRWTRVEIDGQQVAVADVESDVSVEYALWFSHGGTTYKAATIRRVAALGTLSTNTDGLRFNNGFLEWDSHIDPVTDSNGNDVGAEIRLAGIEFESAKFSEVISLGDEIQARIEGDIGLRTFIRGETLARFTNEDNVITFYRPDGTVAGDPISIGGELSLDDFIENDRVIADILDRTYDIQGGAGQETVVIGTLTDDELADIRNGTANARISMDVEYAVEAHTGFDPSTQFELRLGGTPIISLGSHTLQDDEAQHYSFPITKAAADAVTSGQISAEFVSRTRGSNVEIEYGISNIKVHTEGVAYASVKRIADGAAADAVAPVAKKVDANKDLIDQNTTDIGGNTDAINVLKNRTLFTPSEAQRDLLGRPREAHSDGDVTYPIDPFDSPVVRWQVGTGLSLDSDGVTINTDQRRALYGLGVENDKAYFVKTVSAGTSNLIYRVNPTGSDEPIFTTGLVNGVRVWQAYSLDPNDTPLITNLTTADLPNGVPYEAGDGIGWIWETFDSGAVRLVPVIFRADGTTKIQCNDITFGTGAAANLNPDRIAIATGTRISDVWVAHHTGIGVRHSELAEADFREAGLGLRVVGDGRDFLTMLGNIEWTGNSFVVKEGALKIRKADGTVEVFTAGGEIPTATINAAIQTYLADNPISPTQATVVRRDYDSTILQTAASASLGGNTGLWVIANQQTGAQGIPVANVTAGTGVTLPTAVNGIVNLPPGTLCRIRSGTDILVMFIPVDGTQSGPDIVTLLMALTGDARLDVSAIKGLATVATTGDYGDLANRPTIPTKTTDAGEITSGVFNEARIPQLPQSRITNLAAALAAKQNTLTTGSLNGGVLTNGTVQKAKLSQAVQDILDGSIQGTSGTSDPDNANGADGDYYVNTAKKTLWFKNAGSWSELGGGAGGNSVIVGAVAPDNTNDGEDGDFYFNTATNVLSFKTDGKWEDVTGTGGGTTVLTGTLNPGSSEGVEGNLYINLTTRILWRKYNTGWRHLGIGITQSNAAPSNDSGEDGDLHFNTSNNTLYVKISGVWQVIGGSGGGGSTRRYQIDAYLRIHAGDIPSATALTSGGVWSDQTQSFTTKPTFGSILGGEVYDDSDLPTGADQSTDYDYWRYTRYWTEGEGVIAGTAWRRIEKIDQDPASGGGTADGVAITYFDAPIPNNRMTGTLAWTDIPQGGKLVLPGHPIMFTLGDSRLVPPSPTLEEIRATASSSDGGFDISTISGVCLCVRESPTVTGQLQVSARNDSGGASPLTLHLDAMRFPITAANEVVALGSAVQWTNLNKSATNTGDNAGEVSLEAGEIAYKTELAVTYGTATTIGGGTDSHGTNNDNKVYATNIALAILPPYNASNNWVQFGGFGRGAQQYVIQVQRASDGGLTLEAVDTNSGTNQAIYSVWAR